MLCIASRGNERKTRNEHKITARLTVLCNMYVWRRTELFYILTDHAVPRLYYSGNQMETCSTEISIIYVQKRALGRGLEKSEKIFIFFGTRNAHFCAFSGQFEYSCLGCRPNTVLIRPTPALRSVKKDRNAVPVVKKRTGTAFRCVPVPNEPCLFHPNFGGVLGVPVGQDRLCWGQS